MTQKKQPSTREMIARLHEQLIVHQNAISYLLTKYQELCDENESLAKKPEEVKDKNSTPSHEVESESNLTLVK